MPRSKLWIIVVFYCGRTSSSDSVTLFLRGCNHFFWTANIALPRVDATRQLSKAGLVFPRAQYWAHCSFPSARILSATWLTALVSLTINMLMTNNCAQRSTYAQQTIWLVCVLAPKGWPDGIWRMITTQSKQDGGNHNWNQATDHQIRSVISITIAGFNVPFVDKLSVPGVTLDVSLHSTIMFPEWFVSAVSTHGYFITSALSSPKRWPMSLRVRS